MHDIRDHQDYYIICIFVSCPRKSEKIWVDSVVSPYSNLKMHEFDYVCALWAHDKTKRLEQKRKHVNSVDFATSYNLDSVVTIPSLAKIEFLFKDRLNFFFENRIVQQVGHSTSEVLRYLLGIGNNSNEMANYFLQILYQYWQNVNTPILWQYFMLILSN